MLTKPIARDPLDSFTDREQIVALFEQVLHTAQPAEFQLLSIKGNSGTGKTFLISYLTRHICPKFAWPVGQISFTQSAIPNFHSILTNLEDALKGCVPRQSLLQYREKRDAYNRRFDEYRAAVTIHQSVEASDHASLSNITQNVQIDAQLHERELQLRSELSRALIELAEESTQPLCLFIDGYERLTEIHQELIGWLLGELFPSLARTAPQPLLVVTCGWEWPTDAALAPFMRRAALTDFDPSQVRSYLEKQEVMASIADLSQQAELVNTFTS